MYFSAFVLGSSAADLRGRIEKERRMTYDDDGMSDVFVSTVVCPAQHDEPAAADAGLRRHRLPGRVPLHPDGQDLSLIHI